MYTELKNSEDLQVLSDHVRIKMGGAKEISSHFREMVEADIFIPCSSSLSTWAAYLSTGLVEIHQKDLIKHFNHDRYPSNFRVAK